MCAHAEQANLNEVERMNERKPIMVKKNNNSTFHSPPLFLQSVTVPVGTEGNRELLVNDLPGTILERCQRTVQPLILDNVHIFAAQFQQKAFFLVGPILSSFPLLEPLGRS